MRELIKKLAATFFVECIATGVVAMISAQWVADHSFLVVSIGLFGLGAVAAYDRLRRLIPEAPSMPLHEAARYVARDSVWAENYLPEEDREWMQRVERQICHKLATDQLTAWGVFAPHHAIGSTRPTKIEPNFWENAGWEYEKLAFVDPVIGTVHGRSGDYSDVVLYPSQVRTVWPRRSLKARLLKQSPVERLDRIAKRTGAQRYPALWRAQDWHYRRFRKER